MLPLQTKRLMRVEPTAHLANSCDRLDIRFSQEETLRHRSAVTALRFVLPAALIALTAAAPRSASDPAPRTANGAPAPSAVLGAMRDELARSMQNLKAQPVPPYFLSYEIIETHRTMVRGAFGTLLASSDDRGRVLNLDMRVGSPAFDNTHAARGGMGNMDFADRLSSAAMPIEDDPAAIRRILWYSTDRRYKRAVERLARVKTDVQMRVTAEDTSADFSPEAPQQHIDPIVDPVVDRAAWAKKIRAYTAPFVQYDDIYDAQAVLSVEGTTSWYVNSDGSALQTSSAYYRLILEAYTKADDGMILPRYESFVAFALDKLPSDSVVIAAVTRMIADLHALKTAPVIGAMTAPAILSGRASGVFFHEVFGHRIEGHRLKDEGEGQTFKGKIGEQVLPPALSVVSDPTQHELRGTELAGYYQFDDEGVKARRVDVVDKGVFKNFLMSRSPISGFAHSNGHGRAQPGMTVVARQSNLIVSAAAPVSHAELKRRLIALIKAQQKPFGLIFDDIEGGFTITQRFAPNAFDVIPVMVYRVFPDGREELVRGVDLIGTPLTVFGKIVATDDNPRVFNGVCGAESGWVPVSAVSPALLLSQIEVQKKAKNQETPPILPAPKTAQP